MQEPQIIGFGAQKAGTSWLAHNLGQNPGVWAPPMKELHYFTHASMGHRWMVAGHRQKIQRLVREARDRPRRRAYLAAVRREKVLSEEWYRAVYAACPPGRKSFDITPAYALLHDEGLRYMHELLGPSFRGIYQIRDPADRAVSSIKRMAHKRGVSPRDTDFWLTQVRSENVASRSAYRTTIERLDRWLDGRMLYLPFRMVRDDPRGLMRQVEAHCGLPATDYLELAKPRHVSPIIAPSPAVLDDIRFELRDQYAFLEARFGAEFVSRV